MNNLYRGPFKDASYQVSIHLAKRFQRKRFLKSANQKQELSMDQDEMSNVDRGPSIDASCQVSVHLAEGFQRRRLKCEKLTDRRRTPSDGKSSHCLWQGELKMYSFYFISLYNFSFQYLHRGVTGSDHIQ